MELDIPATAPGRNVAALAAGAGEHADIIWELYAPAWAPLRQLTEIPLVPGPWQEYFVDWAALVNPDADAGRGTQSGEYVKWWSATLAEVTPAALARRRDRQRASTWRSITSKLPGIRGDGPSGVPSSAVKIRSVDRCARWVARDVDHPHVVDTATRTDCVVGPGQTMLELRGEGLVVRRCDLWAATIAAALVEGGPDRLRCGLQLAQTQPWTLTELLEVTAEVAPRS